MKKIRSILVAILLAFCSFFFIGCGEVKVTVEYGVDELELAVKPGNAKVVKDAISGLTKDGYEIEDVYTDSNYATKWDGETISKGMSLFVKWIGSEYSVIFDANGGEGEMPAQTIRFEEEELLTANAFTRTGYSFKGWALTENAQTATISNSALYKMDTKGIRLYAVWEVNPYSVTFNANGGTGTMENQTINYGASQNLTANTFTREGYTFKGWATSQDALVATISDGASYTMNGLGTTLYAVWEKEAYTINIKNGSDTLLSLVGAEFGSVISAHADYVDVISGLTAPAAGKVFGGLFLDTDTNHIQKFTNDSNVADFGENGATVNLVVYWADQEGTIEFDYVGATGGNSVKELNVTYGDALTGLPTPTKTGSVFMGWYTVPTDAQDANFDITKITESAKVTQSTVWDGSITKVYALWASSSAYTLNYDMAEGSWDSKVYPTTHNALNRNDLETVSRPGYTFLGWETEQDMIINGIYAPKGTVFAPSESYIPANSFVIGSQTISLKAKFEIQSHKVMFKALNETSGQYETVLEVSGNSFTAIKDAVNYSEQTLYGNMKKQGFGFDGWYKSNSDFTEANKYDAKNGDIPHEDIIVYARYIAYLAEPTNINIEQTSTMVTWDTVAGADYYLVKIDGASPVKTTATELDTGMLTAIADDYTIEVKACKEYVDANNEAIDSEYAIYNFTRNKTLTNSILTIKDDQGNFDRYILFTGNTYTWTSKHYTVDIKELSEDGLVTAEKVDTVDAVASTISANTKTGTFKFVINYNDPARPDEEYLAQIVEDVQTIAYGEAYSRYFRETDADSSSFLNTKEITPYLVGTANGFDVDFVLKKAEITYTDFDKTNTDLLTYTFEVKEGDAYRPATETEIPERKADGKLYFNSVNAGKEYRITVIFKYSKQASDVNPTGRLSQQFVITLNQGVNVYTHEELKTAYADTNVSEINILRNITAYLSEDQIHEDGTPINVHNGRVFDNNDTISDNKTKGAVRKTDGNVYKRAYTGKNYASDKIVVNGNYCLIDASQIPVAVPVHNPNEGMSLGVHSQVGLINTSAEDYVLLRPHMGVFYYNVPFGQGATFNNIEIAGNKPSGSLGIDPGANGYREAVLARLTAESGSYVGFYSETSKITVNNIIAYKLHQTIKLDAAEKAFASGKSALDPANWDSLVPNNAKVEANYLKSYDIYQNAIYTWEGKEIKVYNSYFAQLNGPAVQVRLESTPTHPIIVIDKNTVVDNYMTGTESWFAMWGLTGLAGQLKSMLQPALYDMGASALNNSNGSEAVNMVFILEPIEKVTSVVLEDGTVVPNAANAGGCTVYFGGEKALLSDKFDIDGEKVTVEGDVVIIDGDKFIVDGKNVVVDGKNITINADALTVNEVKLESLRRVNTADENDYIVTLNYTRSTGVKAFRDYTVFTSGDLRANLGPYAFGVTPFASKDDFDKAALATQQFLTSTEKQAALVQYALGAIDWTTASQTTLQVAPGVEYTLEQVGMKEEQFKAIADVFLEYAVVREAVITAIGNGITSATASYAYDSIISGIVSALGYAQDNPATPTVTYLLKNKATLEYITSLFLINESDAELISFNTIIASAYASTGNAAKAQEAVAMFVLLKFCNTASLDAQAVELITPVASGHGAQIIYIGYGFKDQLGWQAGRTPTV